VSIAEFWDRNVFRKQGDTQCTINARFVNIFLK